MMRSFSPKKCCTGAFWGLLLIFPLTAGCGNPKGTVSGVVNYQGKPLTSGFVTFIPEHGVAVNSPIDSEGKYNADKVPVGPAKITIQVGATTDAEALKSVKSPKSPEEMKKVMMPRFAKDSKLPTVYGDPEKSGLTYEVKQGPQKHDIDLK